MKTYDSLPVNALRLGRFLPSCIQEVPIQKSSSLMSIFFFFGSRRRLSGLSARKDLRKENRETEKKGGSSLMLKDISFG